MKNLQDRFCWYVPPKNRENSGSLSPQEQYRRIVGWAGQARGTNPDAFDAVTAWLLEAEAWSQEELAENRRVLMEDIIGRFAGQTRRLREELDALAPSGLVNMAVFDTLDRLEEELAGETRAHKLKEAVGKVFADFSAIRDRRTRELFAGGITGSAGTDTVEVFGYINFLKDCDAGVQWALFMPEVVERQQEGFRMELFEYRKLPAMRFIGIEKDVTQDAPGQQEIEKLQRTLDAMEGYRSGFDCDALLMHHFGRGVDVERCHLLWGRFMAADAPVPEGYAYVDFVPDYDGASGMPYLSQFAYAEFTGDPDAMHGQEGFDCDAMYDVTRNTILAQNVRIPYPEKYWTAEVFPQGFRKGSSAYLFSVDRKGDEKLVEKGAAPQIMGQEDRGGAKRTGGIQMSNTAVTIKEITFTKKDGSVIRGRIYLPEKRGQKLPTVIFCHGFGSNYRELMHHGEGFAEAGICCLFFDFCGGGPQSLSDGTLEEMTVATECRDLRTVMAGARELDFVDPGRIFLQGESMGGLVCALVAAECGEAVRALVLWYPAFGIPEGARKRYEAGGREVFGLRLGEAFDREAKEIDVYGTIPAYRGPVLMIHGDQDSIVPMGYSERALSAYGDARLIVIPGAGHGYDGADSVAARERSISFIRERI